MHRIKCPECLNYMLADAKDNGYIGRCPVCKSLIIERQRSQKEKLIRILKN